MSDEMPDVIYLQACDKCKSANPEITWCEDHVCHACSDEYDEQPDTKYYSESHVEREYVPLKYYDKIAKTANTQLNKMRSQYVPRELVEQLIEVAEDFHSGAVVEEFTGTLPFNALEKALESIREQMNEQ
jgi:hypothetical protein